MRDVRKKSQRTKQSFRKNKSIIGKPAFKSKKNGNNHNRRSVISYKRKGLIFLK